MPSLNAACTTLGCFFLFSCDAEAFLGIVLIKRLNLCLCIRMYLLVPNQKGDHPVLYMSIALHTE